MRWMLIACLFFVALVGIVGALAWRPVTLASADLRSAESVPDEVLRSLRAAFQSNDVPSRYLPMVYLGLSTPGMSQRDYSLRYYPVWISFRVFFSEREMMTLFSRRMWFGDGEGIAWGATKYFGKTVAQLSSREVVYLEVVSRSPGKVKTEEGRQYVDQVTESILKSDFTVR